MRAVVQRVRCAKVEVEGKVAGEIGCGFVVLIGVEEEDTETDAEYIAVKVHGLRVFEDSQGKMNLSLRDVGGGVLAVSQFTLFGDCRKGRRPSFVAAAGPEKAERLYNSVVERLRQMDIPVAEGKFQGKMLVELANDGPVTILLDSKKRF
ncbi:MAG TPA: D-aminoacyl-tRNA deacylase [Candidatus Avalokitesvara rifleensis]|uniref:D-aminoacyl-tRNA deacylase n=1 Tax=Candidatus Avalokitesvara rifleensis TaxID=3367620 RepID=UPI00271361EF|nr:D-aminoacyl-tRNA deacylase [Candidatus Brocadiales bacterium]